MDVDERKQKWFENALNQELRAIRNLPLDLNIHKGGNLFWVSLIKIASLSKAGAITKDEALIRIKEACVHLSLLEKNVEYQWNRAYQRANPRYPDF